MTSFVALLRAVNVGGTGTLPMAELKKMCEEVVTCPPNYSHLEVEFSTDFDARVLAVDCSGYCAA